MPTAARKATKRSVAGQSSARRAPRSRRRPDPRVVLVTGPVAGQPDREFTLHSPATVATVIREHSLAFRLPTVALLIGPKGANPVLRRNWTRVRVKRGETLCFLAMPAGGDGNGSGKQILALVATIALSIAAPGIGTAISGAMFGGSVLAANIASAAFLVGGSLLLNAFLSPPKPDLGEAEQVYLANASSNRIAPLEPVPVLNGRLKYAPPLAARPYSEFEGNEQHLYQLHCLTCGIGDPQAWHIGETLAWTDADGFTDAFSGIEIEVIRPGDPITLFPANVVVSDSVSGQTVPDPTEALGGFAVNQSATQIEKIAVDFVFPGGLYSPGNSGSVGSASRHLKAEYRSIDNDGLPIGGWSTIFEETFSRSTRTPQRFSRSAAVPPGRYEVRLLSATIDTSEDGPVNRVAWTGLRGYLTNWVIPPDVTLVATKIRANDQMSQASASQYFFTVQRRLPVYDSDIEAWTGPVATNSIAWAAADMLRNTDYGLGLDDSLFDLPWLVAYDELWQTRGDEFNAIFDRKWIAQEALNAILRCGRASAVRIGGRIGFVRDEPKSTKRAMFTSRNIVRGSFQRRFVLFDDEAPDYVEARYIDRTSWQERTVRAVISSVGEEEPQDVEYFGITDRQHAWREAIYDAASNAFRREFVTFQSELEGKLLTRGSPVVIEGPLFNGVSIAALSARAGDQLTIDRDFEPEPGATYYVMLRAKDGSEWGPVLVDSFPTARSIVINTVDRSIVEVGMGDLDEILPAARSEMAHVVICTNEARPFDGLVVSVQADGPDRFTVLAVKDDLRVHQVDHTEVAPAPYVPPPMYPGIPEAPAVQGLYAVARRGTVHIELEAGWQPASGATRYVGEISYDAGAEADPGNVSWTPIHDSVGTRFTQIINPQPWTLRIAAIGVRQGVWSYVSGTTPTPSVGQEVLSASLQAMLQQLDVRAQASLSRALDDIREQIEILSQLNNGAWAIQDVRFNRILNSVGQTVEQSRALVNELREATASDREALALSLTTLLAETPEGGLAQGLMRFIASSAPDGVVASFAIEVRATTADEFEFAGFYIDVGVIALGGISRIRLTADQVVFDGGGGSLIYQDGKWSSPDGLLEIDFLAGRIIVYEDI